MKKIYKSPVMLTVTLQHQSHILETSIHAVNTNLPGDTPGYGGADDPTDPDYGDGFDAKGFTSKDLWDNEW